MTTAELLARIDAHLRPAIVAMLPPRFAVAFYSWARQVGISALAHSRVPEPYLPPPTAARQVWGITFRSPLFNAAGMFKNGEGYMVAYLQGAGAYLVGTTTALPRMGNIRRGIALPFVPYPRSRAASNWLGLPNPGHRAVAARIAQLPRYPGFPIGASVALDPGDSSRSALERLVEGMMLYADAGVDFFELNESCPNTEQDRAAFDALGERLTHIATRFLDRANKPVVVKLSADVTEASLEQVIPLLAQLGYSGITLGNTSTDYERLGSHILPRERRAFSYFVRTFGGGISGEPLRPKVLRFVAHAARMAKSLPHQFAIIAVGGIFSPAHLAEVFQSGATLAQWYTGYFDRFASDGHRVYAQMMNAYAQLTVSAPTID
ncbi:MAG: hypothetical protein NZ481_07995 [Candidatus Kapabacteria bacterium]|nr:hypothetical protein [Candidatus Kapabacteria bacterium]